MLPAGVNRPINETIDSLNLYSKKLRKKAEFYQEIFDENYPDMKPFTTLSHRMTMVLEQLNYYRYRWIVMKKKERLELEHVERLHHILSWIFVHSFSLAEFHVKNLIERRENRCFEKIKKRLEKGKRVKFRDITEASKNEDLITEYEESVWDFLREIRNAIVHNNGVFDTEGTLTYSLNARIITLKHKKNEAIIAELDFYHIITEILYDQFHTWVERYFKL